MLVGFGLLLEGGADGVLARTTEAGAIGQRKLLGPAGVVLVYGIDGGHAATDLVLAAHQRPRTLRCDQDDIEVGTRGDLVVMHVETVREQQAGARRDVRFEDRKGKRLNSSHYCAT